MRGRCCSHAGQGPCARPAVSSGIYVRDDLNLHSTWLSILFLRRGRMNMGGKANANESLSRNKSDGRPSSMHGTRGTHRNVVPTG